MLYHNGHTIRLRNPFLFAPQTGGKIGGGVRFYYAPENGNGNGGGSGSGNGNGDDDKNGDDKGGNGKGGGDDSKSGGKGGGSDDGDDDENDDDADDKNSKGKGGKGKGDDKKFTQAEMDAAIEKRLAREKKNAETKQKEEEGKFKDLYEPLKTAHEKLEADHETLKSENDKLKGVLNSSIDAETKDWPESIKKFDPGPDNYEARSTWRDNSRAIVDELSGNKKGGSYRKEHGSGNGGGNGAGSSDAAKAVTGRYGPAGLKRDK